MGIIEKLKGMKQGVETKLEERERKKKAESIALRAKRQKSAPLISKIAKEYGAGVEILDTSAYVSKKIKGEEKGVHIPYGLDSEDIRNKMDKAFHGSSTVSKVKSVVRAGKQVKKALNESGLGRGSMWEQQMQGGSSGGSRSNNPFEGRPPGW